MYNQNHNQMKLSEKLGLSPEQKEELLEELLAEKTLLNVKSLLSLLTLSSINMRVARISKISKSLSNLKGEEYEKALETLEVEMEKVEALIKKSNN